MNEIMYADNYSRQFQAQDEFFDCLKAIGGRSRWERKRSKDLRLVAIMDEDSKIAKELKEQYEQEGLDIGILTDTMENTRLVLKAKDKYYPVRSCAIKTILDRAGISGAVFKPSGEECIRPDTERLSEDHKGRIPVADLRR